MTTPDEETLNEMRERLQTARADPAQALALAEELLARLGRMLGKVDRLTKLGDRTQSRLAELNREIRQQEERYRGIFENSTEGIFLAGPDGALLAANPALAELLDQPPQALTDAVGQVRGLFFDAADHDVFVRELTASGRVRRKEVRVRTPRGPVWCLLGAASIQPDGHVVGMTQDITARKRLEEELLRRAATDPLTGLPNRRAFFEAARRAFGAARRSGRPVSLLMADVDHFKAVNDTHGHEAGDAVLRELAALLQDMARATDLPARIGGEEFAVLCPDTGLDGAMELAERLRGAAQERPFRAGPGALRVTLSFGAAQARPGQEPDPACCLARADQALYRAKRAGRNRVCADRALDDPAVHAAAGSEAGEP